MLVNALVRRANREGGFATVLAKGDATAGAILIIAQDRGEHARAYERGVGAKGDTELLPVGPEGVSQEVTDYWIRRRRNDPDLWVVEVDIAAAERFVAETILDG
ncbi:DUF1491 family protein [Sphingomonas bacterium]|uniref:DUF1491 family protein n=1 Tax=Sphingomonas bacterium TaxID=1895847 RepID=UPI0026313BCF|nr:DUF1491 family protein [Sphingomonas bacterium]MDB5678218.1 hypothetical protein [Sphingomonas bacterium]